jgi:hypothetical protein
METGTIRRHDTVNSIVVTEAPTTAVSDGTIKVD